MNEETRQRVIVMDDDSGIRETLEMALDSFGYEVYSASSREEFIGHYREVKEIYAVILDNQVPYDTRGPVRRDIGVSLAGELLRREPQMRIALHTGDEINDEMRSLVERGICYLKKPASLQSLRDFLRGIE
jgi:DNA-binding NtrC family response regulator